MSQIFVQDLADEEAFFLKKIKITCYSKNCTHVRIN